MDLVEVLRDHDLNGSNGKLGDVDYFKQHPVLTWTYLVILVLSTILGNVGNFLIIAAVLSYQRLRTKANVFVVSLAVADVCVATVVQYFSIVGVVVGYGFFLVHGWLCHTVASICQISCAASLLNMIGVAINRYICICRHAWYHRVYTKRNLSLIVILIWLVAFFVDFPQFWGWGGHSYDNKTMLCSWNRLADYSYTVFFATIITLPSPVILFCYISIFIHVQNSRKAILKMGCRIDRGSDSSQSVQLAKTLFLVFMVYLVCWLPYVFVVVLDFSDRWPKALHVFTVQFAHTNSSINSVIYGLSNPAFRKGYAFVLKKIFFRPCCPGWCVTETTVRQSIGPSGGSISGTEASVPTVSRNTRGLPDIDSSLDGDGSSIGNALKKCSFPKKRGHYEPSDTKACESQSVNTSFSEISVKSLPI